MGGLSLESVYPQITQITQNRQRGRDELCALYFELCTRSVLHYALSLDFKAQSTKILITSSPLLWRVMRKILSFKPNIAGVSNGRDYLNRTKATPGQWRRYSNHRRKRRQRSSNWHHSQLRAHTISPDTHSRERD